MKKRMITKMIRQAIKNQVVIMKVLYELTDKDEFKKELAQEINSSIELDSVIRKHEEDIYSL